MPPPPACCTCATLLADIRPIYDEKTEKAVSQSRDLECCERTICNRCITKNPRFASYCPFCQISIEPSSLPQGLRDPPAYEPAESSRSNTQPSPASTSGLPPPYSEAVTSQTTSAIQPRDEDIIHHLRHPHDTLQRLSLLYNIPASTLRSHNKLPVDADSLLLARSTIRIPAHLLPRDENGNIKSLSPDPIHTPEEDERRKNIHRFMRRTRCIDHGVAGVYLDRAKAEARTADGGTWEDAVRLFLEDERWARENPGPEAEVKAKGKGKAKKGQGVRWGFSGQLS